MFHISLNNCNYSCVYLLIKNGADISSPDKRGYTPLHLVCEKGSEQIIKALFDRKAELNIDSTLVDSEETALHLAVNNGRHSCFDLLIQNGADISKADKRGYTPLHLACEKGFFDFLKMLLKRKTNDIHCKLDIDSRLLYTGETALDIALRRDDFEFVRLLIENGADISSPDKRGYTPLHLACEKGDHKIVKMLLNRKASDINSKLDINSRFVNTGETALDIVIRRDDFELVCLLMENGAYASRPDTLLQLACKKGNVKIVKMLLDRKAKEINSKLDIDSRFVDTGETALDIALKSGNFEIICLLIEHGADISRPDRQVSIQFHLACLKGDVKKVKMVLDRKAELDIDSTFINGDTALHIAIKRDDFELVCLLMKNGADICRPDKQGWTPLHLASKKGNDKLIKIFIDIKAKDINSKLDINSRTVDTGETALHIAVNNGRYVCAVLLIENGADVNRTDKRGCIPFDWACMKGNIEILRMLLDRKAVLNINRTLANGNTATHLALMNDKSECAELLIENGADISKANNKGMTPLHIACEKGLHSVVELMLKRNKNINVNIQNIDGRTPLDLAHVISDIAKSDKTIELLLYSGANPNLVMLNGNNPLHIAAQRDNLRNLQLLIQKGAQILNRNIYGETIFDIALNNLIKEKRSLVLFEIFNIYLVSNRFHDVIVTGDDMSYKDGKDRMVELSSDLLKSMREDKNPLEFVVILNDPRIGRAFLADLGKARVEKLLTELAPEVAANLMGSITYDLDDTHLAHKIETVPEQPKEEKYQIDALVDMFDELTGYKRGSKPVDALESKLEMFLLNKKSYKGRTIEDLHNIFEQFTDNCKKRARYASVNEKDKVDFWTNIEKAVTNTIKVVKNFEGSPESIYRMKARLICEYLEIIPNCGTRLGAEFDELYFLNKSEADSFSLSSIFARKLAIQTKIPKYAIVTTELANQVSLERVSPHFDADTKLPDLSAKEKGMIAEEHIFAILYDKLIHEDKRKDVVILPFGPGNEPPKELSRLSPEARFVIAPCSVQDNSHNTVLVIDREKEIYFYFDSRDFTTKLELDNIIRNFSNAGFLTDNFKHNNEHGTHQIDGWSCGFHVVENAVRAVNNDIQVYAQPGINLRKSYINNFKNFVKNVGFKNVKDVHVKSFQDDIYKKLSDLRREVLESLVPRNGGGIHFIQPMLARLTKYNIPIRQMEDLYARNPVVIDIEFSFRRKYLENIFITIKNFLKFDSDVKELYFKWLEENGRTFQECSLPEEETKQFFDYIAENHIEKTGYLPKEATDLERHLFEVFKVMPYSHEELSDEARNEIITAYFTPNFWMMDEFEKIKEGEEDVFEDLDPQLQQAIVESGMRKDLSIFKTGSPKQITEAKRKLLDKFTEINSFGRQVRDEDVYFLLQQFGVLENRNRLFWHDFLTGQV